MLTPHRRHLASCDHADKGWNYPLCACPIWCDGKLRGRRYRKSLGTTSWERALTRIEILERGGDLAPETPDSPAFSHASAAFLKDCRARHLATSTVATYERTLGHYANRLGDRSVASIDIHDLDAADTRELK